MSPTSSKGFLKTPLIIVIVIVFFGRSSDCSSLRWVNGSDFILNSVEPTGLRTVDPIDRYFIGRSFHSGGVIIGCYSHVYEKMWATNRGKELTVRRGNLQVLVYPKGVVTWAPRQSGVGPLPYNLVLGGMDPTTKEHLYICRAQQDNTTIPGQVALKEDKCTIPSYGKALKKDKYEMLALSLYGVARKATSTV